MLTRLVRPALAAAALALVSTLAIAAPATQPAAYPLTVDVMTGAALPASPIVEQIDGREVHFADQKSVEAFKSGGEASQKKMDALVVAAEKPTYKLDTCPVSGEKLAGDMGEPIIYVDRASNQLIELCCGSCLKKVKKDPAEALHKIADAQAKG